MSCTSTKEPPSAPFRDANFIRFGRPIAGHKLANSACLGLASVALSGSVVATLDPTLAYRMRGPPWYFSDAWLSFFFLYSSIVYTFVSVPVGWLVDRFPDNARAYKTVTALGFVVLGLTFALLAPIGLSAWGVGDGGPDAAQAALNNLPTGQNHEAPRRHVHRRGSGEPKGLCDGWPATRSVRRHAD